MNNLKKRIIHTSNANKTANFHTKFNEFFTVFSFCDMGVKFNGNDPAVRQLQLRARKSKIVDIFPFFDVVLKPCPNFSTKRFI